MGRINHRRGLGMSERDEPRGFTLTKSDQVTLVAVTIGILVVTGLLVGLLF